ncbi:MAG: glycosyltransferase, partial [Patescibacteria group bacterium]
MPKTSLAVIIPAYNEADNIAAVVAVFVSMPECTEVIVVDDGSVDKTAAVAAKAGARVIKQNNQGKGVAMQTGVNATNASYIFFADADLVGWTSKHARSLITPVTNGRAVMPVG